MAKKKYTVIGSVKLEDADAFIGHALLELEAYRSILEQASRRGKVDGETLDEWKHSFRTKAVDRYLQVLRLVMSLREYFVREKSSSANRVQRYMKMEAAQVQVEEFKKRISAMNLVTFMGEARAFLHRAIGDLKIFRADMGQGRRILLAEYARESAAA